MRNATVVLAGIGLLMASQAAQADVLARVEIIATNSETGAEIGRHTWEAQVAPGQQIGNWTFGTLNGASTSPWVIGNGAEAVAVHGLQFGFIEDPQVTASFNVSSGVVNTSFTINSSFLSFPTISNAVGIASAFIGVTDSATFGNVGSVSLIGLQPGGAAFSARYNGSTQTFANLITGGTVGVAPGGSVAFVGQNPSFPNYDALGAAADDMQSQFRFTLSAFDRASGTSTFEIIPAPGAAALLGLGGLVAARRRRA